MVWLDDEAAHFHAATIPSFMDNVYDCNKYLRRLQSRLINQEEYTVVTAYSRTEAIEQGRKIISVGFLNLQPFRSLQKVDVISMQN